MFQNPTTVEYTNHTDTEIITTGGANTANAVRQREILCSAARADTIATAIHTRLINEKKKPHIGTAQIIKVPAQYCVALSVPKWAARASGHADQRVCDQTPYKKK